MAEKLRGPGPTRGEGTEVGQYAAVGVQYAAGLLFFIFGGSWLDKRLGTSPWLLLLGVVLGFGLSTLWIYRKLVIDRRGEGPGGKG